MTDKFRLEQYLLKITTHGVTNDLEQLLYVGEIGCTKDEAIEIINNKLKGMNE